MNLYSSDFYKILECYEYETRNATIYGNVIRSEVELAESEKLRLTDKEMKITFNEYCRLNQSTYELPNQVSKDVPLDPKPVYPPKK